MNLKIKQRQQLAKICEALKRSDKKVGFTSGVFDIIHPGHIDYLKRAKEFCDVLVVGISSDDKGKPLLTEKERMKILSTIKFVDHVVILNEGMEEKVVKTLKPHYYIKSSEQKIKQSLLKVIKKIGIKIQSIPLNVEMLTLDIIERISKNFSPTVIKHRKTRYISLKTVKPVPAVFLDRDGTINEEIGSYVYKPELFKMLPNSVEALKKIQNMKYKIVIITAQQGIGLGYYSFDDFYRVNRKMLKILSRYKIYIDKIYFCPHTESQRCNCRKPNTGLVELACDELNIDLSKSFFIGDKMVDIECGKRAGLKAILVRTGYGGSDKRSKVKPDYIADDLLEAAEFISRFKNG